MDLLQARTRLAPSPTGHMHLGTARTALYDYLLARRTGGQFILRIEDTDMKRTVPGAEQEIIDGVNWLGLEYDEGPDRGGPYGPYRQSERFEIYQQHARILVESDHAYPCFCTPDRLEKVRQLQMKHKEPVRYDGTCRRLTPEDAVRRVNSGEKHTIRFKTPREGATIAYDALRGNITIQNENIDDYVIIKSDGWPTYHLAAMVDDHLMKITHVLRGSEWLGTFPLHVNIVRAFGWDEPHWVHLSVFLKPSGKGKMSKREAAEARGDGYSIFVKDMPSLGFIPEGVLWFSETGVLPVFSFEEVEVPTQENIVNKIKSEEGQFILLGGDHSLTYPAFKGFALNHKKNPGIIVFDAHPDLMSVTEPVNHENYLRALIEQNIIKKENVILVGTRNPDPDEIRFIKANKIKFFPMIEIAQEGKEAACDAVMAAAKDFDALYLSVDLDAVDAAFVPGVTYPEVAGLTSRELFYFLHRIKKLKNLKAVDVVELNPDKDIRDITALLAAKLVYELC